MRSIDVLIRKIKAVFTNRYLMTTDVCMTRRPDDHLIRTAMDEVIVTLDRAGRDEPSTY